MGLKVGELISGATVACCNCSEPLAFFQFSRGQHFIEPFFASRSTNKKRGTDFFCYVLVFASVCYLYFFLTNRSHISLCLSIQKFYIPFPNVGTISSVQVALEAEGDVPGKKRRSIEKGRKMKRWFNGWGLENVSK